MSKPAADTVLREFQVFAKPAGAVCNLDCHYCYYLEKQLLYPDVQSFCLNEDLLERFFIQQMGKGLLLSPERTVRRKVREMFLARDIEKRFSKQEILYLYLNQIYFGHGAYGIGEAARSYFDKDVRDLTISEGALLAGLPKAPSRYSPHGNPEQAELRRRYVLERMLADGFLNEETHAAALADAPVLAEATQRQEDYAAAASFTEEVRRTLFEELGGDVVLKGGLEIETPANP